MLVEAAVSCVTSCELSASLIFSLNWGKWLARSPDRARFRMIADRDKGRLNIELSGVQAPGTDVNDAGIEED